jgi:cytochrome c peroxidase
MGDKIKVQLGDPALTGGITGKGNLTINQINDWLAREDVHQEIDPELPMGLSAAAANVFIPEDNPMTKAKIELGRQLYFDTRLSSDNTISCASCHHPDDGFGRKTRFGVGVDKQEGGRNSPVSFNRIVSGPQFWDGRAATLEEQAVGPIANPIEMGNTHENAVATIKNIEGYALQFNKIFPGEGVTIDNIGKAIATFERAIVTGPAPYDYLEYRNQIDKAYDEEELKEDEPELYQKYLVAKEKTANLSDLAIKGRDLFFSDKSNCTTCHAGANFTDEKYHNLGVGMEVAKPDIGRAAITKDAKDTGAFKTPTVRNIAMSPPFMHDGSQKTLEEVVEWYAKGGHANPHLSDKVKKLELSADEKASLVAFMKEALASDFPKIESGRLP